MTPKQKADDLWFQFDEIIAINSWADEKTNINEHVLLPKKCALLLVNEILEITKHESPSTWVYFINVKKELQKL